MITSPKPGLVDRINNGAHKDMDLFTFMDSASAIIPYFPVFFEIGSNQLTIDSSSINAIRSLGIKCEKAMYAATGGINTHKGAIFSLSIISTAAGFCYSNNIGFNPEDICYYSATIAKSTLPDLGTNVDTPLTNGEKLYNKYGIMGIRGEAASGFSSVQRYSLPLMKSLLLKGTVSQNDVYLQTLLTLIANVTDTNTIARCGIEVVDYIRNRANQVLALGGALTPEGKQAIYELDQDFISKNISPGGCADLLSVTIALYQLEQLWEEIRRDNL